MRWRAKMGLAGVGAAAALAFVLLAPIVPLSVANPDECSATSLRPLTPPTLQVYASVSYALTGNGLVYVVHGGYFWWLPHAASSTSKLTCI